MAVNNLRDQTKDKIMSGDGINTIITEWWEIGFCLSVTTKELANCILQLGKPTHHSQTMLD